MKPQQHPSSRLLSFIYKLPIISRITCQSRRVITGSCFYGSGNVENQVLNNSLSHVTHALPKILIWHHVFNKAEQSFPGNRLDWMCDTNLWELAAVFLAPEGVRGLGRGCRVGGSGGGLSLLPSQPHYTGNETGTGALFQYLNAPVPLKAPCWDRSANSSMTHHYGPLVWVPPLLLFFFSSSSRES